MQVPIGSNMWNNNPWRQTFEKRLKLQLSELKTFNYNEKVLNQM